MNKRFSTDVLEAVKELEELTTKVFKSEIDLKAKQSKIEKTENRINILGYISPYMEAEVAHILDRAKGDVTFMVNSPGGSSFAGMGIANRFMDYDRGKVTTVNNGIAASAASMIFIGGEERLMKTGSRLMIHDVMFAVAGNAKLLEKWAAVLNGLSNDYAEIYAERSKYDQAKIRSLMQDETFFSASEAVEAGFATGMAKASKGKPEAEAVGALLVATNSLASGVSTRMQEFE